MEENSPKASENQVKAAKAAFGLKMLDFGLEFAVILALPLIGFIYLGRWLEGRYHSKLFVVGGILLAITLSGYLIYRKILEVKKLIK